MAEIVKHKAQSFPVARRHITTKTCKKPFTKTKSWEINYNFVDTIVGVTLAIHFEQSWVVFNEELYEKLSSD